MTTFLIVLHIMVCLVLIGVVLLQRGKGAEMGAAFGGGGANTVFGSRGAGNFLTKITSLCAAIFMVTSISLAYINIHDEGDRLFDAQPTASDDPTAGETGGLSETGGETTPAASPDTLQEIPQSNLKNAEPTDSAEGNAGSTTP